MFTFNRCANIIKNPAQYKLAKGIVEVQHTWIEWELVVDHVGGNQLNIAAALQLSRESAEILMCAIIQLRRKFYTNEALEGKLRSKQQSTALPGTEVDEGVLCKIDWKGINQFLEADWVASLAPLPIISIGALDAQPAKLYDAGRFNAILPIPFPAISCNTAEFPCGSSHMYSRLQRRARGAYPTPPVKSTPRSPYKHANGSLQIKPSRKHADYLIR
jgi:hypothetical protein